MSLSRPMLPVRFALVAWTALAACSGVSVVSPHDGGNDLFSFDVATDTMQGPCTRNDDCARSPSDMRVCDVASGRCVACTVANDTCSPDRHCVAGTNTCAPGCRSDEGCRMATTDGGVDGGSSAPATHCNTATHACVQCTNDMHCPSGQVCSGNLCVPGCNANQACPMGRTCCSGACVDPQSAVEHCGMCGNRCVTDNATPACTTGRCAVGACTAPFGDCDTVASNGCETNTQTSAAHCGRCGNACAMRPNTTTACMMGACAYTCIDGAGNCDMNDENGCETVLATTVEHCGRCGSACPTRPNAASTCTAGACGFTCNEGFADCDMDASNGCEADLRSSVTHCGRCGNACPTRTGASASCSMGMCGFGCSTGRADCDLDPSNGCEVDTTTSGTNCGRCGNTCTLPNTMPTCAMSACVATRCNTGFGDCNSSPDDGCEVDTTTSVMHCGRCGSPCPARANAVVACMASVCAFTCNTGFGDCDGNATNGCETDVNTATAHCGACGRACATGTVCIAGACHRFTSTGAEGAFAPTANVVLTPGVHNFTTINIPAGVRVTTTGTGVLDLRATGAVNIAGTVDVSGAVGGSQTSAVVSGASCVDNGSGSGGGATGDPLFAAVAGNATGRASNIPGPAGTGGTGSAGTTGGSRIGTGLGGVGGNTGGGGGGAWNCTGSGGGGGGGYAGGGGGFGYQSDECSCSGTGGNGGDGGGTGGGTGGRSQGQGGRGGSSGNSIYDGQAGLNRAVVTRGCGYATGPGGGGGGGSIGSDTLDDLAMATTFRPGSAGGGGGGDEGAGGGGGGGALRITTPTTLTLAATARIAADGGRGGYLVCGGGPGGGGSGGAIYLYAPTLNVASGASVTAAGGVGGGPSGEGRGGLGRIRISAATTTCTLAGTFNPPLVSGCTATAGFGTLGRAYVGTYPN